MPSALFSPKSIAEEAQKEIDSLLEQLKSERYGTEDRAIIAQRENPFPSKDVLEKVVHEAFWASLLTEESRFCRFRLIYRTSSTQQTLLTQIFEKDSYPVLTQEKLRSLAFAHDPIHGGLIWDEKEGTPRLVGIGLAQSKGYKKDFIIQVLSPGCFDIFWQEKLLIHFSKGISKTPSKLDFYKENEVILLLEDLTELDPIQSNLIKAVKMIALQGHGGSIWLTKQSEIKKSEKIKIGHPFEEEPERHRKEKSQTLQEDAWSSSIAHLAGVDGAILIGFDGHLIGFGTFIDLQNSSLRVIRKTPNHEEKTLEEKEIGGGRHRSAVQFCTLHKPSLAYVISEDKKISVIRSSTKKGRNHPPEMVHLMPFLPS